MNQISNTKSALAAIVLLWLLYPMYLHADVFSDHLRAKLSETETDWAEESLDWQQLRTFYEPDFQSVWFTAGLINKRAEALKKFLTTSDNEGLNPEHYHLEKILQYWDVTNIQQQVRLELLLSDAFFRYSRHVQNGRLDPVAVDPDWHIDKEKTDTVKLLRSTLDASEFTDALYNLPPQHLGYKRLREILSQYRQLTNKKDWPEIPAEPKLAWGIWHDNIKLLRRRLILLGDLSGRRVAEPRFFDQSLKQAVERFQLRHGLNADGVIGKATLQQLNTPISEYITQIKLNMERWRWLPRDLGKRYIMVNTASYQLYVMENNKPRLAMRVITGTRERPTPVVGGRMRTLILNPYWYIPEKIAIEDILPRLLEKPDYLAENGIRLVLKQDKDKNNIDPSSIDWKSIDTKNFPYRFRQDPGKNNSLGNIKFPFSNNYAIYLHDTPARHLFNYQRRAFSSGCIRVEDPLQLASYLLEDKQGWNRQKLQEKIGTGEALTVRLPRPINIYLVYWTVWVGADNTLYFQKDIYNKDKSMRNCG